MNDKCKRCNGDILTDYESQERACSKCGMVVPEVVVTRGFGSFQEEGNKTHSGQVSIMKHDQGINSSISGTGRDASGKSLPKDSQVSMMRLKQWQNRVQVKNSQDKNLRLALRELENLVQKLNLSAAVGEQAAQVYRKALSHDMIKGRSIHSMVSASLCVACRLTQTQRTLTDVANMSNVKRKDVAKCYRLLVTELNMQIPIINPIHCVNKIGTRLEIPEIIIRKADKILEKVKDRHEMSGKDPMGVTSAALYVACERQEYPITQRQLSQAAGVTDVTVRNRCKALDDLILVMKDEGIIV